MPDVAAWVRDHGAYFDVGPLVELVRGRQVQVGCTVSLYARVPQDERPRSERWLDEALIRGKLHAMAQSLAPPPGSRGRLEIQPERTPASFMAADPGRLPEVAVTARVFHGGPEAPGGEDKTDQEIARRLLELGVKERPRAAR